MTEEDVKREVDRILLIIKNPELAIKMAEATMDGKYVLWNQTHVDRANQETGCTITLDDIDYVRDLIANEERKSINAEIERIAAKQQDWNFRGFTAEEKDRLKKLYDRNTIIQNGLASHYHNLSAFRSA